MNLSETNAEHFAMDVLAEMDREFHQSPDRVIAVVGAAYLDSMLDQLLRAAFIEGKADVDHLLRPDGCLGANGSRYSLCYCLGLITREQRDDLKIIAKIRNAFAHNFRLTGFDVDPVSGLCASLQQVCALADMPARMFPADMAEAAKDYVEEITATPREKYRMAVFALFGSLLRRLKYVRRLEPARWFTRNPDQMPGDDVTESL